MLNDLLKNRVFSKIIKDFLERKDVLDVIIFGSVSKGKDKPNDLDILIIYNDNFNEIHDLNYELRKKLEKFLKNIEIIGKKYSELSDTNFLARESLLNEGYSLKHNKYFSEIFGFNDFILFFYNLNKISKSKKMIFYYALNGRGNEKGILKKYNCFKLSDSLIIAPIGNYSFIKEFLEKTNAYSSEIKILIPEKQLNYLRKKEK